MTLQAEILSVTEGSRTAGRLAELLTNDGTGYDTRPDFDVSDVLFSNVIRVVNLFLNEMNGTKA